MVGVGLLLCAASATLTIGSTSPFADAFYRCGMLLMAGWMLFQRSAPIPVGMAGPLLALSLWGFLQLALGATVYAHATLERALELSAHSAAALVAFLVVDTNRMRESLAQGLAWFTFVVAVVGVATYYSSPGQILWLYPAAYPDTWGPFLSRNNFAQFLELGLPAALWCALGRPRTLLYGSMAATIVAGGLISASRAGATLLLAEAALILLWAGRWRTRWTVLFALGVALLAAIGGAETLWGRFQAAGFDERPDLYRSTLAMIAQQPGQGYGLGTYRWVYPEFARFDSGYAIEHAHNDWLEAAAEGGVVFALAWFVLEGRLLQRVCQEFWALGAVTVLVHALVDFPLSRPGLAAWVFILYGAVERTRCRPPLLKRRIT